MNLLLRPVSSSLGKKYLMAITGLALMGFVVGHMAGNLLIYAGPDAINTYAQALKHRPALLWTARTGLLVVFLVHLYLGFSLWRNNRAARPVGYAYETTMQASWASRNMMLTGIVLLTFILYHLAHFTFGVVKPSGLQSTPSGVVELSPPRHYLELADVAQDGKKYVATPSTTLSEALEQKKEARHDVYSMVIAGFRNPFVTASYLLAMVFLGIHLWHGGSSWFQSLGINGPRVGKFVHAVGPVLATIIVVGNCSIPLAVLLGIVK